MKKEEYLNKINELKAKHQKELESLHLEYARENCPFRVGDIVTDHKEKIRVEIIRYSMSSRMMPSSYCIGPLLTKKGVPFKNGKRSSVWQGNVETINGEKYEA